MRKNMLLQALVVSTTIIPGSSLQQCWGVFYSERLHIFLVHANLEGALLINVSFWSFSFVVKYCRLCWRRAISISSSPCWSNFCLKAHGATHQRYWFFPSTFVSYSFLFGIKLTKKPIWFWNICLDYEETFVRYIFFKSFVLSCCWKETF